MLGAIIGDIAGSRFESHNIKRKKFDFFNHRCRVTDDSVMSLAIAKAILDCDGKYNELSRVAVSCMQRIGRQYPRCGYGKGFRKWLHSDNPLPYNSYGNGAAMRVSACAFAASTIEDVKMLSQKVTEVTHDHSEGLKGAEATAVAGFLAKTGSTMTEIRNYINRNYYKLDFTLEDIRSTYSFDVSCQNTVPQAITAFLESHDFEDAIRNAVSIGGDSDTIAAIAGGIAGAYYDIPEARRKRALEYLDEQLTAILVNFEKVFKIR